MKKLIVMTIAFAMGAAAAESVKNGKKLYTSVGCYECHGRQGQGGSAGPRLAPRPIPLQVLVMYVLHPAGAMPPYTSKLVSDAQLRIFTRS